MSPPTSHALATRAFAMLADAGEVLERPALLALCAEVFGPDDDATLVLATEDVEALRDGLGAAAAAVGLTDDELPDLLALPIGGLDAASDVLAGAIHVLVTERPVTGPLAWLPHVGVADGARLRALAETRRAAAAFRATVPASLALPDGYVSRDMPEYFDDPNRADDDIVHQPDVYAAAAELARRMGCTHIIDVGCGAAEKLVPLAPEFQLVGVDFGPNLEHCRRAYPEHTWLQWNIEREPLPELPARLLAHSVVVCADVIEHLVDPTPLIAGVRELARTAPAILLSTPDRARVRGVDDAGPPPNAAHVREWALDELVTLLSAGGVAPAFAGHTINNDRDLLKRTSLVIIDRARGVPVERVPDDFLVTAVLPAFNEADIVEHSIRRLVEQGVRVHLVDNWSTDDTAARAQALGLGEMVTVERFPPTGPSTTYDWGDILRNTERIAAEIGRGWIVHQDVDEIRVPPWPGVGLREALYHVERCGYDAVDHTVIDFAPVDAAVPAREDFEARMRHFEFGRRPGHFVQVKTWNAAAGAADLAGNGGHDARFPGRRVFPYKFLAKHYPVRSQEHGERKVLADRAPRWNPDERELGWHHHYDAVTDGHRFVRDPDDLLLFDDDTFATDYVVERLTGVGILRARSRSAA